MKFLLIILLGFLSTGQIYGQRNFFVNDTLLNENNCAAITFFEFVPRIEGKGEYLNIYNTKIVDNCLELNITYGGGCGPVNCRLLATKGIIKTNPPKTELTIQFEDRDNCEALISEKIRFDLSPFNDFAKTSGIYLLINGKGYDLLYKFSEDN